MNPKGGKPWVQFYEEKKSSDWQDHVAEVSRVQALAAEVEGEGDDFLLPLEDCRLLVRMRFNVTKPKSYPARVVDATKKPDIDNLAKGVLDGLVKGRVIADDNAVTDLMLYKRYVEPGHPAGVEVEVTAVPCEVP